MSIGDGADEGVDGGRRADEGADGGRRADEGADGGRRGFTDPAAAIVWAALTEHCRPVKAVTAETAESLPDETSASEGRERASATTF